ncbi:MAG: type VI secretion system contractile sheath large subunit [Paracoccaceae bacterium]
MAENQTADAVEPGFESIDQYEALLKRDFNPKSDKAETEVNKAVRTLAARALEKADVVPEQVVNTIKDLIREIDGKLSEQVNEILHNSEFQQLEGAWRGLKFLCERTETGADLKIKVMNISKKELYSELQKYPGTDWDQSPLFQQIYERAYGTLGGEPVSCIVGDYHFDHTGTDVDVLADMAKVAAAAHAPFIAGASHTLFDLDSWADLPNKKELATLMTTPPYMEWRGLREKEDSRYIGLACPRFLARRAYGPNNPVDEFDFVEETGGADASKFCWANSAYAMATNITRAYKSYGWCAKIRGVESGGAISDLPTHTFKTEKGTWADQCPTEISITDRREKEMADLGLMPLQYQLNSNLAAFIGAQSLHNPPKYDDSEKGREATKNAALGARLPYMFACSRFAHFLKHMVRNKIGSHMERDDMQRWLGGWIQNYVNNDASADETKKARRPLAGASVEVGEDPENPGQYDAKFFLRPHYQLEGVNVSLRLVSKLPSDAQ